MASQQVSCKTGEWQSSGGESVTNQGILTEKRQVRSGTSITKNGEVNKKQALIPLQRGQPQYSVHNPQSPSNNHIQVKARNPHRNNLLHQNQCSQSKILYTKHRSKIPRAISRILTGNFQKGGGQAESRSVHRLSS